MAKKLISERIANNEASIVLFGSSVSRDQFHDVDIGILPRKSLSGATLSTLREAFEESLFPYPVDIIDLSTASDEFRNHVLSSTLIWLTPHKKGQI